MEKIAITVEIPALNGTYDFVVPSNMSIRNAQNLRSNRIDDQWQT